MSENQREAFVSSEAKSYSAIRERYLSGEKAPELVSFEAACANAQQCDFSMNTPPAMPGTHVYRDFPIAQLRERIDWTPFFQTWELHGRYPAIFDDKLVGSEARKLFDDAQAMLDRIEGEGLIRAHGVAGFWPIEKTGQCLRVMDESGNALESLYFLRQQFAKQGNRPHQSLVDFVAPEGDWIGAFCVSAGDGVAELVAGFEADHDDYNAILAKALADRLAEAFAEKLHEVTRRELWGYAPDEAFSNDELIGEAYRGIRPAPGYPACPDHTQKAAIFRLLDAEQHTGVSLTEHYAMTPTAAVCGLYFAHPDAKYFGVGKVGRDQVTALAEARRMPLSELERWLSPNLAYDPSES